jgi:hypothetical protein
MWWSEYVKNANSMKKNTLIWLMWIFLLLGSLSCTKPLATSTVMFFPKDAFQQMEPEEVLRFNERLGQLAVCADYSGYIPDTTQLNALPIKWVRVAFHFMNSKDSIRNFPEKEAAEYAWYLLDIVNKNMAQNYKLNLPANNDIPVLPTRIQYRLFETPEHPAIQHHYDDSLYFLVTRGKDRNLTSRTVIDKYAGPDSILHIFMMPHHPDSMASPTYAGFPSGIALGNSVKVCGAFENNKPFWDIRGLLAHELGHVLGLSHAWTGFDGCPDTEKHPNRCFSQTGIPPCDGPVSNNMMDYNAQQHALSPCQIGKMQANLSREGSSIRRLAVKNWCHKDSTKNIVIDGAVIWDGAKDLLGDIIVLSGASLTIRCRVSMPSEGRIVLEPGATLHLQHSRLHNDCGLPWGGIWHRTIPGKPNAKVLTYGNVIIEHDEYYPNKI